MPKAKDPQSGRDQSTLPEGRELLLAMTDFGSHTSFFTSHFAPTFACSLSTHLVNSPMFRTESGQPLSVEDQYGQIF